MVEHKNKKTKPWLIISVCVVVVLFIFDAFFIGNVAYLLKWRECGSKPVVLREWGGVSFGYQPSNRLVIRNPGMFDEKVPGSSGFGTTTLYCSLNEVTKKFGTQVEVR